MKSPFEDSRLRQQTLKMIEFQRQDKFLASPNDPEQDAPPIPTIKELGLPRARHPYDYEVHHLGSSRVRWL